MKMSAQPYLTSVQPTNPVNTVSPPHLILIYQGEARARRFIAHLPEGETLGGELGQDGAGSERQGARRRGRKAQMESIS